MVSSGARFELPAHETRADLVPERVFAKILPTVEKHATFAFRSVFDADRREERIQDTRALAWKWTVALLRRGRDPRLFKATFANLVTRAVKSGRSVCGQRLRDIHCPQSQQRHGFRIVSLSDPRPAHNERYRRRGDSANDYDLFSDQLRDNTRTPVPDQAAFRVDFPAWLQTVRERDRRMIAHMVQGEGTAVIARIFGISPARISQLRSEYRSDWMVFTGEARSA
jgi:hypothetical protein